MYNGGKAILWLSLLSLTLGISAAEPAEKPKFHINDAHLHFVDFLQNTDGIETLIERMDQANVDHQVVFGLPVMKKWNAVAGKPIFRIPGTCIPVRKKRCWIG